MFFETIAKFDTFQFICGTPNGWTPLHYLVKFGRVKIAKCLIQNGSQVDSKSSNSKTPLIIAAKIGKMDMVKLLIESAAQINEKEDGGNTPLHYAVKNGHYEIVQYLVEHGAKLDLRNKNNQNPLDVAIKNGYIAKYLLKKKTELENKIPEENISNKALCIICFTPRNGIFVLSPCGHTSLCEPCCLNLKNQTDPECPTCRKPIKDYMKIFFQEADAS